MATNGHRVSFRCEENVLVVMVAQLCEYIKTTELHALKRES